MRFGLLGPLLVADDTAREIPVPAARQRAVLAALLVSANRAVSVDELVDLVWDGAPPGGAGHTLRAYVMRLRQLLGAPIAARIVTRDPGYLIIVEAPELDALQFESLCQQAAGLLRAGAWAEASAAASEALGLWRGEPLLDVSSSLLREQFTARLDQLRVQVLEDRAEADLHLGRHERLVPHLRELAAAHPLRERFHAQLMLALARAGRQAEALEAFRDARRVLVEQLGVEPGQQLQDLHQRLLRGEPASPPSDAGSGSQPTVARAPRRAPRQLPAAARHFTGRQTELGDLLALTRRSGPARATGDTVVISAIDGMAGIGKTALAVRAAHALAERFPGGQLFIDLHGYTKGRPPRGAGEALEVLLRTLGVSTQRIPVDVEERAALYRERLAELSTLIVLDNAADEAQVRPLLPGHAGCLVLITSRRRLKGLDDAHSLSLDLLPPADAVALLRAVAGPGRIPADDPLLGQVAGLCGNLPLALRIVGALLRHRPAWDLGHLAGLLRDQHRRVHALFDGERDLGAVFDLSYSNLDEQHRLLFRRLGLVPGSDSDAYAAAALLEADPTIATVLLEDLVDHNLLIEHAPGRYRLHDLLRVHARALSDTDPAADRADTLDRLLRFYAYTSQSASILIARQPRTAPDGPCPVHGPALPDPGAARAWLRAERDNLEAACIQARALALHDHALALTAGLAEILRTDGPFARALALHQAAADCAAREGRLAAHATALTDLGIALRLTGSLPRAGDSLTAALEIHRAVGNRHGEATALTELGLIRQVTGDVSGAEEALTRALEIYQEVPHRGGEATALANLGLVRYLAGNLLGAADPLARARELYRAIGNRHGEANAVLNLGRVRLLTGATPEAAEAFRTALEIYRESGHRSGEADALTDLGIVRRMAADLPGAAETLALALDIYRAIGNRQGEASALDELGLARHQAGDVAGAGDAITRALEIFRDTGNRGDEAWVLNHYAATVAVTDLPRALALYREALAMNRELDKPDGEALALEGLGECHISADEHELGTTHLHQALEIYQRLGLAPDAERVRARLANLVVA